MMTTKIGVQAAADYLNGAFQTGWIPGEQEDLSSPTLKKPVTVEYVAPNQFKIMGLDWTDRIQKHTRFRFKQGGDFKYFECTAVSVNADTLVTVDGHGTYTVENATIIDFWFSNSINPFGWPEYLGLADIGGWTSGLTAVYASATSITIAGIDVTDRIQQGTKIRYKQGGDYKYDFVSSAAFSTDTTLTLMGGSTVENETITDFAYSNIANPIGWPFGADYIEGENENGTWRKWVDGTLECWGTKTFTSVTSNLWVNPIYISSPKNVTWPISFAVIESANINVLARTPASFIPTLIESASSHQGDFYFWRPASFTHDSITVGFSAKGRWE